MELSKYTLQELLLIYFNQSTKANINSMRINLEAFGYSNYDDYSNYDNYDDYSNYDNYDNYTNYDDYSNYDNYSEYSDYSQYSEGCFAKGTLISMKDGTFKKIEDIKMDDEIVVFDHESGELTSSSMCFVRKTEVGTYSTVLLTFEDGKEIEIFDHHGFYDVEKNEYVIIGSDNVNDFVGHHFIVIDNNKLNKTKLVSYKIDKKESECYSLLSAKYVNHVANSLLCVSDALEGLYNIYECDENLKYDKNKKKEDIEKYGLFTYDEWKEYVSEEEFDMFNFKDFKVSIAKGLCSEEDIKHYIKDFLAEYK